MEWTVEKAVVELYRNWCGQPPSRLVPLPPSGSNRQYFRLLGDAPPVIAAFNPDVRENHAFLHLSRHFADKGLPVPKVLAAEEGDAHCYLLSDLGDTTLFSLLPGQGDGTDFPEDIIRLYKKTIDWLTVFQVKGAEGLDFDICYPRHAFDRHSMMWDLNYFKYYFLKLSGVPFDEQKLEDDFERFTTRLLKEESNYFMYRDFQSRNVMVVDGEPWFIDYQGGRRGALQYDIASILFDAKANIPFGQRTELLGHYMEKISGLVTVNPDRFRAGFFDFVLLRIMQALGTYGFRGGVEKKPLFLQSVPYALNNLRWISENGLLPGHIPYLSGIIERIASKSPTDMLTPRPTEGLTLQIRSFSYKRGIPADNSGNGGGFVFDCRALPNPGRLPEMRALTGRDAAVRQLLKKEPAVTDFLTPVEALVGNAVENYLSRGFDSLMVSFGCTGGQHRSVYCAENLARALKQKYPVGIDLVHCEEPYWPNQT
jgi:aminoglycoside/choline kinase family phosphotransferase